MPVSVAISPRLLPCCFGSEQEGAFLLEPVEGALISTT